MSLGAKKRPQGTFDATFEFKDTGAITASAAAQVDSAAKVVNVGAGLFRGCMIIDVSAMVIANDDEQYRIVVQGSPVEAFTATGVCDLAEIHLGASQRKLTDSDKDDAIGRYKVYFDNENNGTFYPWIRVYTYVDAAGTAESITYVAYCVPMDN